ncbi:putative U box domain, armadillo-like helical, Zinc finger, RING/FYVE/PHD-type [Helianthus annuus]|nr:putative U box domain, armadillo-like helical, Zinc finger, RING/FYVE/PHD-type [Helianthus annuus]
MYNCVYIIDNIDIRERGNCMLQMMSISVKSLSTIGSTPKSSNHDSEMEFPQDFRCPISMELMKEPVIISTGVTYERKNIEKWFFSYNKKTCPATMQNIVNFCVTPNYTLKRLILVWQNSHSPSSSSSSSPSESFKRDEIASLLNTLASSPFKVKSLKKLKEIIKIGDERKLDFKILGGLDVLFKLVVQILLDCSDFAVFQACEEALGVLQHFVVSGNDDGKVIELLSQPECMKSMVIILQRGSKEARVYVISILKKLANSSFNWKVIVDDQGIGMFKSMLELASDEISTKVSSSAFDLFIKILDSSKKSRSKAIEAGAMCTLIELLPDANKSKCEKILQIIKLLCECVDGRVAFTEHRLATGAVSTKMFDVSDMASKICVKIFSLICSFHPTEKVLEEMMVYGVVKKLVVLLHTSGQSSTKNKVVDMFKKHGNLWSRYPCFPDELKGYLCLHH